MAVMVTCTRHVRGGSRPPACVDSPVLIGDARDYPVSHVSVPFTSTPSLISSPPVVSLTPTALRTVMLLI